MFGWGKKNIPEELPDLDESIFDTKDDELESFDIDTDDTDMGDVNSRDEESYFSELAERIKSDKPVSLKSDSIIKELNSRMNADGEAEKKEAINRRIENVVGPLEKLEREWKQLRKDISKRKDALKKAEDEIRKKSEELKAILKERDRLSKPQRQKKRK